MGKATDMMELYLEMKEAGANVKDYSTTEIQKVFQIFKGKESLPFEKNNTLEVMEKLNEENNAFQKLTYTNKRLELTNKQLSKQNQKQSLELLELRAKLSHLKDDVIPTSLDNIDELISKMNASDIKEQSFRNKKTNTPTKKVIKETATV